jgi:hypothetical protein
MVIFQICNVYPVMRYNHIVIFLFLWILWFEVVEQPFEEGLCRVGCYNLFVALSFLEW